MPSERRCPQRLSRRRGILPDVRLNVLLCGADVSCPSGRRSLGLPRYPPLSSVVDELITARAPRSLASDLCQRVLQHHLHLAVARNSGVAHVERQIVAGVQHEGSRHRNVSGSRRRAPVRRHKTFQDDAVENILQKVAVVTHVEVVGVVNVGWSRN